MNSIQIQILIYVITFRVLKRVPTESAGGGTSKLMRNEIFNDSQLEEELNKFNIKFRSNKNKFNKPLKELLERRSTYRIKQKMTLKEEHLKMYRRIKDDIEGYEMKKKKLN